MLIVWGHVLGHRSSSLHMTTPFMIITTNWLFVTVFVSRILYFWPRSKRDDYNHCNVTSNTRKYLEFHFCNTCLYTIHLVISSSNFENVHNTKCYAVMKYRQNSSEFTYICIFTTTVLVAWEDDASPSSHPHPRNLIASTLVDLTANFFQSMDCCRVLVFWTAVSLGSADFFSLTLRTNINYR